jgi:amino acid adenylation domain-containing protein
MSILDLDYQNNEDLVWHSLRCAVKQDVHAFCRDRHWEVSSFYQRVWAIVLNRFTTSQCVAFAINNKIRDNVSTICEIDVDPEKTFVDLMADQPVLTKFATVNPDGWDCNTGVIIGLHNDEELNPQDPSLTLQVLLSAASSGLWLVHSSGVSSWHAQNLASAVGQTLEEIARNPHRPVKEFDLFSEQNRLQVAEWLKRPQTNDQITMLDAIRQHASQRPTHEAIFAWDGRLNYAELDNITTRLAHQLLTMGIEENAMVLLGFEKSMYALVSLIAIFKAGAIVVPVNPTYPKTRMQAIIDATNPRLACTSSDFMSVFEDLRIPVLALSSSFVANLPTIDYFQDVLPSADLDRTAYVLFTSGSTGRPKGVVHSHRNVASLINQASALQIYQSSRVLQFAPMIFAGSLMDMYLPLIVGATVCIASQQDLMNDLETSMKDLNVTFACMTPSAVTPVNPTQVSGLKTLALIGEPISEGIKSKWAGFVTLLSGYGQTESMATATVSTLRPSSHSRNIGVSPASRIWLVDPLNQQKLAPVGAMGEILIAGANVCRGYLNDPEKTAAAILEPPESIRKLAELRLSRVLATGDLARYEPDGSLVYVGRKDTQVKIRGKRVELGEVEATIRLHRPANDVVIVEAASPLDGEGILTLIGFIHSPDLLESLEAISSSPLGAPSKKFQEQMVRLDSLLCEALPEYMAPKIFMPLARIPKTASGKTDRRALRELVAGMTRQQMELYIDLHDKPKPQPRTAVEKSLHDLFSQILNREPKSFGTDEQFLRLGGDSIRAIQLVQLCRSNGLPLDFKDVMGLGTVASLAKQVNHSAKPSRDSIKKVEVPTVAVTDHLRSLGIAEEEVEAMSLCSSMQEGILMSQLKDPNQHAIQVLYDVQISNGQSAVDLGRLQVAWKQLVQRHPMLRTIFVTSVSQRVFAVQVQLKNGSLPRVHQIHDNLEAQDILDQRLKPRSPSELPQISLHVKPNGTVIVELEISHTVTDGMSMSIIARDLCQLYGDRELSPLMFKYVDYVDYQQTTFTDDLSYWTKYLSGLDSCRFPTIRNDGSRDLSDETHGISEYRSVSVDVGTMADYQRFSQDTGTTLASVVKLAWALVLSTFCGTDDVSFGYLNAGRDAPFEDILDSVGPLINLMAYRQQIDQHATVAQVLQTIQSDFVSGLPHQGLSLSDIRRSLGFGKDEVIFNTCVSQFPIDNGNHGDDLPISLREVGRCDPTEFDLNLEIMVSDDDIKSALKAYTGLVPVETMERVGSLFGHAMITIIKNPDCKLGMLNMLPKEDCDRIRHLNRSSPQAVERCAHEVIQEQCLARPAAPAVCGWDGNFTYGELDHISTCLAQKFQTQGIAPEEFVPVLMDKSRWVPIALLAILKAGGAFVLLEPTQPIQRLREICDDLKPSFIISSPEYQAIAADITGNGVVILSNESPVEIEFSKEQPNVTIGPRNAAYVVFTSGSTGKPKGVVIEHRSLCTSGLAMRSHSPMNSDTRMYQYASHAFDVSILDLTMCFMSGGCLCIPSAEERQNRLLESLNGFQATYVALTPTVTRTLQPEQLTFLRTLKVSGEPLLASDIQRWIAASDIKIVNMYGPAECTINVTADESITSETPSGSIGYAMCNSTAWIVDPANHQKLLPMGAVGELVIQGPVVGRGYLKRPEQTAASFIPAPRWLSQYLPVSGEERLYKTGDLVQYATNGSLLYKGRKDFQVKLRGQRFELNEVEEHLRRAFPDASDTIAEVVSLNQGKTKALAGFIYQEHWGKDLEHIPSPALGSLPSIDLLHFPCEEFNQAVAKAKASLDTTLPGYMRPSIYLPLTRIPRSRSGKTDRGLLRQIVSSGLHEQWASDAKTVTTWREPKNETESVLCKGVAEVLGLSKEKVGPEDNFFSRGGDSVAAMMLVGALRQENYHLTVANIFDHPRLDVLAEKMHRSTPTGIGGDGKAFSLLGYDASDRRAVIQQAMDQCNTTEEEIEDVYPCSPLQHSFFLYSVRSKEGTLVAQFAYNIRPEVDLGLLRSAWKKTTQAHPGLRTRIIHVDGKADMHNVVLRRPTDIEDYEAPAESASDYIPGLSIDVAPGKPLLRAAIVHHPSHGQRRLLISLQHSIYDGWALRLIMEQVERAYSGLALKSLPVSPFIAYLKRNNDASKKFWTKELKDLRASSFPQLPSSTYTPHPSILLSRKVAIPKIKSHQITLSTKIRWAWAKVISLYTGNSEVAFGVGTAGRGSDVAGIERMITPTLGIFPYRLHVKPAETVIDALRNDQQHYIQTLPHEHYGNPNISRLATGPTSAAALQTLLIVQPQEEQDKSPLHFGQEVLPQSGAFHVRALTMHCYLQETSVEVLACYDKDVISEDEMLRAISMFESIFQQVLHEPEMLVEQLQVSFER